MILRFLLAKASTKGKEYAVDSALDALFTSNTKHTITVPETEAETTKIDNHSASTTKRKRDTVQSAVPIKKRKRDQPEVAPHPKGPNTIRASRKDEEDVRSSSEPVEEKEFRKGKAVRVIKVTDDIQELGERYSKQTLHTPKSKRGIEKGLTYPPKVTSVENRVVPAVESDSSESEDGHQGLVHETVSKSGAVKIPKERRLAYVPDGETKEQREERTVFVGNLPPEVVKSKPLQKSLKRCITGPLADLGSGIKIESIRFRSVAFKAPTNPQALKESEPTEGSTRRKERAAAWRKTKQEEEGEELEQPKEYLTPAEKKRIAFIKGELHDQAASVNAYIVLAHPHPNSKELAGMNPYEAAKLVARTMDGSSFEGRTLRVDRASRGDIGQDRDPASTIFVGSLDFNAKEEDLRAFFETLLATELGPPSAKVDPEDSGDDSDESSDDGDQGIRGNGQAKWVRSVRIVRDKDTQLGKGFAYVRFSERTCVDEVMAMEPTKLKFAKRKLRVDRCKTAPSGSKTSMSTPKRDTRQVAKAVDSQKKRHVEKPVGKKLRGDPSLGERLKGLSKEERREAKKNDPTRQARRMEKKKARAVLEKDLSKADKSRVRERKVRSISKSKDKPKRKYGKSSKS